MLLQNNHFVTRTTNTTMGSTITKMITVMITTMVAMTTIAPQMMLAQRDAVSVDQPPSSVDDIAPTENTQTTRTLSEDSEPIIYKPQQKADKAVPLSLRNSGVIVAGKRSNKIDPSTVLSYGRGGWANSILCSTIARININNLTWLPYQAWIGSESSIARGDAYALASAWAARGRMIATTTSRMSDDIRAQYYDTQHTIFDVYFYKGSNYGVMQGHRAVVFIGTDDQIYILDTIRGLRWVRPQLLSSHFAADAYRGYTVYISKNSYAPAAHYRTMEEYYDIHHSVSLSRLVQDHVVSIENKSMADDDVTLIVTQPLKINPNSDDEIIVEVGAQITVKDAKTLMWWDLVYTSLPQSQWLEAVFTKPILGNLTGPLDM